MWPGKSQHRMQTPQDIPQAEYTNWNIERSISCIMWLISYLQTALSKVEMNPLAVSIISKQLEKGTT